MLRHRIRSVIATPFVGMGPAVAGLAAAMLALTGCSTAQQIPYPKFSSVKSVTKKLLTNEEKNAAIEEMTLERTRQQEQAERTPEAR